MSNIATFNKDNGNLFVSVAYDSRSHQFAIYKAQNPDEANFRKLTGTGSRGRKANIVRELSVGAYLDVKSREWLLNDCNKKVKLKVHSYFQNAIILVPEQTLF